MAVAESDLFLDNALAGWVLFPIMAIVFLFGILRHYATILIASPPKVDPKSIKETQALMRSRYLRSNARFLQRQAFLARKTYLSEKFHSESSGPAAAAPSPLDPAQMDTMMAGMKTNLINIVPQTIIMAWLNYFFSGFVLIKLPFPLTLRFKAMLQSGIQTQDMDVSWVSSLSWYILNLVGMGSLFQLLLGNGGAALSMQDIQAMGMMAGPQPGQAQKQQLFKSEKEDLELFVHEWDLANVEDRLLLKQKKGGKRENNKKTD